MDKAEGMKWYRKVAEQGNMKAQAVLGYSYWKGGEGVAMDKVEAVKWYRKAAEQGDVTAQTSLAVAYMGGGEFTINRREAYIWFSIAAASGSKEASSKRAVSLFHDTNWQDYLSQSEIREAEGEAIRRLNAINNR